MTTPKKALEVAVELISDCVPDDLVEKPEYLRQIKAALPVAELHEQMEEFFKEISKMSYRHTLDAIQNKVNDLLRQREVLK